MSTKPKSDSGKVKIVPLTDAWYEKARVSKLARNHLERSLQSLIKEQEPTPSFPLYESRDALSLIHTFLDSIPWDEYDLPKGWKDYEYDRLKKVGPQGGHPSWEVMQPLFELYQERLSPVSRVWERSMIQIMNKIHDVYGQGITPYEIDMSLAVLLSKDKIFSTAAGCRNFNLKKTDPIAQQQALADISSGLYQSFRMYVFERFNKLKPRIFMPGPFSNMIEQAAYQVPMMDILQQQLNLKRYTCSLYHFADKIGFDKMFHSVFAGRMMNALYDLQYEVYRGCKFVTHYIKEGGYSRRVRVLENKRDKWDISKITVLYVQGDFEKMDTTTGPSQYDNLYLPLASLAFNESYRSSFKEVMRKTVTMPIISPSGVMVGDHGTGSGMENTNNGESWCNLYYSTETVNKFREYMLSCLPHVRYMVAGYYDNGDDSTYDIIFYDISKKDLELAKKYFQTAAEHTASECGFIINDKWRMSTDFGLYNQNGYYYQFTDCGDDKFTVTCKYMYPATLILNSIINPEHQYKKSDWDKDYRDLDVIEKLDNGRYLPYFERLIDFVDNGMKYHLLGRAESETYRILSKWDKYRALQSLSERFNRQDYDIKSSPTVHYVLTKRG